MRKVCKQMERDLFSLHLVENAFPPNGALLFLLDSVYVLNISSLLVRDRSPFESLTQLIVREVCVCVFVSITNYFCTHYIYINIQRLLNACTCKLYDHHSLYTICYFFCMEGWGGGRRVFVATPSFVYQDCTSNACPVLGTYYYALL